MSELRCPICGQAFEAQSSQSLPFCTPRCRQIDLGRWLDERYSVPYERIIDPEREPPAEEDGG